MTSILWHISAYESWYSSQLSPTSFDKVFDIIAGPSDTFSSDKLSKYMERFMNAPMGEHQRQDKEAVEKLIQLMSNNEHNTVNKEDFLRIFRYKL